MLVVSFIGQKGGVGRTTIAASTAAALSLRGYRVWALDLDPNATLSRVLGVDMPNMVNGLWTYINGVTKSVKVYQAMHDGNILSGIKVIPPGNTGFKQGTLQFISPGVLNPRLSSVIRGIANYRVMPNFVIIDTPALSMDITPNILTPIVQNTDILIVVSSEEPGGMGWVTDLVNWSSSMVTRRQEYVVVINKVLNLKTHVDLGVKYVIKILRNPSVEAAWRMHEIPYMVKNSSLNSFKQSIDTLVQLLERLNAERTWGEINEI